MTHSQKDACGGHRTSHVLSWGQVTEFSSMNGKRWAKKFNRREARREAKRIIAEALSDAPTPQLDGYHLTEEYYNYVDYEFEREEHERMRRGDELQAAMAEQYAREVAARNYEEIFSDW